MSDYLWDKTGEPDAEVERLEKLLGGLRHEPRALELPREVYLAQKARRRFHWPALAAAAAFALLLMAGAWLVLQRREGVGRQIAQDAGTTPREQLTPDKAATDRSLRGEEQGSVVVTTPEVKPAPPRVEREIVRRRQPRAASVERAALKSERRDRARQAAPVVSPPAEDLLAVVKRRQREAKEQLVYALRLTSFKLNEVETHVRGGSEKASAGEQPNKIR